MPGAKAFEENEIGERDGCWKFEFSDRMSLGKVAKFLNDLARLDEDSELSGEMIATFLKDLRRLGSDDKEEDNAQEEVEDPLPDLMKSMQDMLAEWVQFDPGFLEHVQMVTGWELWRAWRTWSGRWTCWAYGTRSEALKSTVWMRWTRGIGVSDVLGWKASEG